MKFKFTKDKSQVTFEDKYIRYSIDLETLEFSIEVLSPAITLPSARRDLSAFSDRLIRVTNGISNNAYNRYLAGEESRPFVQHVYNILFARAILDICFYFDIVPDYSGAVRTHPDNKDGAKRVLKVLENLYLHRLPLFQYYAESAKKEFCSIPINSQFLHLINERLDKRGRKMPTYYYGSDFIVFEEYEDAIDDFNTSVVAKKYPNIEVNDSFTQSILEDAFSSYFCNHASKLKNPHAFFNPFGCDEDDFDGKVPHFAWVGGIPSDLPFFNWFFKQLDIASREGVLVTGNSRSEEECDMNIYDNETAEEILTYGRIGFAAYSYNDFCTLWNALCIITPKGEEIPTIRNVLSNGQKARISALQTIQSRYDEKLAKYNNDPRLYFEFGDFFAAPLLSHDEILFEATKQSNCMERLYYQKCAFGETHLVKIRRKSNPEVPYISCEVDNRFRIIQALFSHNRSVTSDYEKEREFITQYGKHLTD